jgi:hypothetical protein
MSDRVGAVMSECGGESEWVGLASAQPMQGWEEQPNMFTC